VWCYNSTFECGEQASPIFKGVTEIWINIQHCKGNNLSTWHTWTTTTPWATIVHDDYQRVESGPYYPSAGLPHDTLTGIRGWPPHYPFYHPLSMVGCHPTLRPLKLQSLRDPINPICAVHNQILFIREQSMRALIDTGGGYHLGAPNLWFRPLSTFASSFLHFPQNAPPGLQVCQHLNHLTKST
jgi:hypothetical protein